MHPNGVLYSPKYPFLFKTVAQAHRNLEAKLLEQRTALNPSLLKAAEEQPSNCSALHKDTWKGQDKLNPVTQANTFTMVYSCLLSSSGRAEVLSTSLANLCTGPGSTSHGGTSDMLPPPAAAGHHPGVQLRSCFHLQPTHGMGIGSFGYSK